MRRYQRHLRGYVISIIVCSPGFIQALEETRSITEPAGALALAGLKRYIIQNNLIGAQKKFVVVVSGANMNFDRLRFVADRAELGEGREALLSVDIPERPGRHVFSPPSVHLLTICSQKLHCFTHRHPSTCSHRIHLPV